MLRFLGGLVSEHLAYAWSLLSDGFLVAVNGITKHDVAIVTVCFLISAILIVAYWHIRDRIVRLNAKYVNRFRRHGFKNPAVWYALSLGSVLLIAAELLILVHDLSELMIWAISLVSVIALIVFTALGWRSRGPSWFQEPAPPLRRFAIFYEPTMAAVVPFVVHKLPDIVARAAPLLDAVEELISPFLA
jgi:hypothetical protein